MKMLLLGGTGAIGAYLISLAAESRIEVAVTTRKQRLSSERISYIQGDAHSLSFLAEVLKEKYDVIVDFMSYTFEEFTKERVNLLLENTNHYFFLSSSRVYADTGKKLITEDTPRLLDVCLDNSFRCTNEYSLTKAKEENVLMDSSFKNWTILRPYITFSEKRLQLGAYEVDAWLPRALSQKTVVFSNDIAMKYTSMTYGEDVAKIIMLLMNIPKSQSEMFNVSTDEFFKWDDILNIYKSEFQKIEGYSLSVKYIEKAIHTQIDASKYQVLYDRAYNRRFDNSKLYEAIGNFKFSSTEEKLKYCLKKQIETQSKYLIPVRLEALQDRVTGEKTKLNVFPSFSRKLGYLYYRYI